MNLLATDDNQLIYIYSDQSEMGKRLLPYARSSKKSLREISLIPYGISQTIWTEIRERLGVSYLDMLDPTHELVREISDSEALEEHDWLKLIDKNPELIYRPIIIMGSKIVQADDRFDFDVFLGADGANMDKDPESIKMADHKDTTGHEKF
ncbi:ArsC family protein [Robiginitalea myxolifaciens]|uniref:ArsC family protein n=1 Tax=Robiginitalea myxolifaciens TaxID=400055 RepID=A0A1I6GCP7_9FLAO|nr:ArsC/Spx/MgsR family protein [Robiginitalea myxolifaciens]SFR39847.1 ArsC family protein [Robiginitalea myxolifaciens]